MCVELSLGHSDRAHATHKDDSAHDVLPCKSCCTIRHEADTSSVIFTSHVGRIITTEHAYQIPTLPRSPRRHKGTPVSPWLLSLNEGKQSREKSRAKTAPEIN